MNNIVSLIIASLVMVAYLIFQKDENEKVKKSKKIVWFMLPITVLVLLAKIILGN